MQYNVSTAKVIVATFFVFCCAGKVCIDGFLTVFLRHMGLTPFQAGVFRSLQALVGGASVVGISYCAGLFHKRLGWAVFILIAILCNVLLLVSSLHHPCFYTPHPSCGSRSVVAKPTSSHILMSNGSVAKNEQIKITKTSVKPFVSNSEGAMMEKYQVIKKNHPPASGNFKQFPNAFSTKLMHETLPHADNTTLGMKHNFSPSTTIMAAPTKAEERITFPREIGRATRSTENHSVSINTRSTIKALLKTKQSHGEANAGTTGRTFSTKPSAETTLLIFNTTHKELSSALHSVVEDRGISKPVQSTVKKDDITGTLKKIETPPLSATTLALVNHHLRNSSHAIYNPRYNELPVQVPVHPYYQKRVLQKRSYTKKPENSAKNETTYEMHGKSEAQTLSTGSLLWPSFSVSCILIVLGLILLGELALSPIDKVADESWYQYLDEIDYIERYDQRMSGVSMTTSLTLLLIALIVKFYCTSEVLILPTYHLHFYTFALFWAIILFLGYFYPCPMSSSGQSSNLFKGLAFIRYMGHDGASSLVLITVFVCGALHGCINDFLLWYMEDLGADEFVTTSAVAIAMASEILPQIFSKYFFRRTSLSCMLSISVFTYSVRFALIALMWTPWAIAVTQILHCLSNYFFWVGIQGYVTRLCFQGTGRSVMFVMHLIHHQLGRALGSCFGGLVYSLSKPKTLFFAMSGIALLWGLLFTLFQYCSFSSRKGRLSESISKEYSNGDELQFSRLLGDEDEDGEDWLELAMSDEKPKKRKQAK